MRRTREHFEISVDKGGTFADCIAVRPDGTNISLKVLSSGKLRGTVLSRISDTTFRIEQNWPISKNILRGYTFRPLSGPDIRYRIAEFDPVKSVLSLTTPPTGDITGRFELDAEEDATILGIRLITQTPLDSSFPRSVVRLGTTEGTNALLERRGAPTVFVATRGLGDVLSIGTQARPDIFSMDIVKPTPLTENIVEADERISANGELVRPLDLDALRSKLLPYRRAGIDTAGVALVNAYRNPAHERDVASLLAEMGFRHVSVSHQLSKRISYLARCRTTLVNAYLAPVIETYLDQIDEMPGIDETYVMSSAGGLMSRHTFQPKDSLLSGPAGGCIGMAAAGRAFGYTKLIGFDMGGTSTDVSRFDKEFDYKYELAVGEGEILTRALDIHTVAAGGGSICYFDGFKLRVGPRSAGANPGPACYGAGGPLCITDINLLAGKLDPSLFGIPIDPPLSEAALTELIDEIEASGQPRPSRASVIAGFLSVADEIMAGAVKTISAAKGFDTAGYAMVAFGGAGGLHACSVSEILGIETVLLPANAGILSAEGLGAARLERTAEAELLMPLHTFESTKKAVIAELEKEAAGALKRVAGEDAPLSCNVTVFCRFKGQNSTLPVSDIDNIHDGFKAAYEALFEHWHDEKTIEVETVRLNAEVKAPSLSIYPRPQPIEAARPSGVSTDGLPVFVRDALREGDFFEGPALLLDRFSAAHVEAGWRGVMGAAKNVFLLRTEAVPAAAMQNEQAALALFANRFAFIAETMGATLRRTAASVNVKERLDFSSALLDAEGRLVAGAHHIPVHLGALGVATRRVTACYPLEKGDIIVTNHPAFGGSHLPDITVISPVFVEDTLLGYVASRAHHAELGGISPGSMPPDATNLAEEGVVIPPTYLRKAGAWQMDSVLEILRSAAYPSRAPEDNEADIRAQVAANLKGAKDLSALAKREGKEIIARYFALLRQNAAREAAAMLARFPNEMTAEERLDDGTRLCVSIRRGEDGVAIVDWQGSGPVHPGNLNGTEAVAAGVTMYVFRLLLKKSVPLNDGLLDNTALVLPEGIVAPRFDIDGALCPAVSAGNTELSQRMTDTLLKAFGVSAASQGTMNNLLFGDHTFGYYETIGGGAGAGPGFKGQSGVHTHMTNTRITDVETVEYRYPIRVERFALRTGSGGRGRFPGGDGLVRELRMSAPLTVSLVTERRKEGPYGGNGGAPGKPGAQYVIRNSSNVEILPGRVTLELDVDDRIVIETPGGGGWEKE